MTNGRSFYPYLGLGEGKNPADSRVSVPRKLIHLHKEEKKFIF
jgi:hypothetical protein